MLYIVLKFLTCTAPAWVPRHLERIYALSSTAPARVPRDERRFSPPECAQLASDSGPRPGYCLLCQPRHRWNLFIVTQSKAQSVAFPGDNTLRLEVSAMLPASHIASYISSYNDNTSHAPRQTLNHQSFIVFQATHRKAVMAW